MGATDEVVLEKAESLAGSCVRAGVRDNQLSQILTHLKRRRDLGSTRRLVKELPGSAFGKRNRGTQKQFEALRDHVGEVLRWANNWQDAARVVGWAKRLCRWKSQESGGWR